MSAFLDHVLQPLVCDLDSYVRDTKHIPNLVSAFTLILGQDPFFLPWMSSLFILKFGLIQFFNHQFDLFLFFIYYMVLEALLLYSKSLYT